MGPTPWGCGYYQSEDAKTTLIGALWNYEEDAGGWFLILGRRQLKHMLIHAMTLLYWHIITIWAHWQVSLLVPARLIKVTRDAEWFTGTTGSKHVYSRQHSIELWNRALGFELDRTTVCLCLENPEKTRLHRSKYRMKMKNFLHHRSNMVNPVPGRCCCFVPSLSLWPMETAAWNCRQHVISMSPSRSLLLWPLACCWMRAHDPHRHTILFWILDYYYYCSPAPCPLLQDEGYDYFAQMLVCSCPVDLFGGVNPLLVLKGLAKKCFDSMHLEPGILRFVVIWGRGGGWWRQTKRRISEPLNEPL